MTAQGSCRGGGGCVADRDLGRRHGARAKAGRHSADVHARQPGRDVDPRGIDDRRAQGPMMGVFNNLVMFDQHVTQNSLASIVPDLATGWSWSEDGTELTLPLRQGVKWHDGKPFTARTSNAPGTSLPADRRQAPRQSAQILVPQPRSGHRTNGDYEVTFHLKRPQPAFLALLASGLVAGLSVPRPAPRHAHPSDRHRPLQIRRVQAERVDQGDAEPGLLEAGAALSRRHRIYDHPEPVDGNPGLRRRQIRHDISRASSIPLMKDLKEPGPQASARWRRGASPASDGQPRQAALRQPRSAAGHGAEPRPQGVHRHPQRRPGRDRRGDACRRPRGWGMPPDC